MSEEQRRFQRILHDAHLQIEFPRRTITAQLMDLSLHGCLIHFPKGLPEEIQPEKAYAIRIQLSADVVISTQIELTHLRSADTAGFVFHEIDLDSMTSLRRLLELNLGDSQILERDLRALIQAEA